MIGVVISEYEFPIFLLIVKSVCEFFDLISEVNIFSEKQTRIVYKG